MALNVNDLSLFGISGVLLLYFLYFVLSRGGERREGMMKETRERRGMNVVNKLSYI